ncbi:MAG: MBL fold metallo-hydrolase [Lachnospiraceae bacterium]|jgi:7,8-dihydropterin-6-yl-methyl-4-(beta-D-ribofuranosyl)aminobenzene 5'-phosphate synthase|nr:MBL fold metallo-hydrolase [Lachnospiraceae bacterium]
MDNISNIGSVQKAEIMFLVENKAEMLIRPNKIANYYTSRPLLAEPGLSILIKLNGKDSYILLDGGASNIVLKENACRMNLDLSKINNIVLSHGHFDHTGALADVIRMLGKEKKFVNWSDSENIEYISNILDQEIITIHTHPEAFRERWMIWDNGNKYGPLITPQMEWEGLGAKIITSDKPEIIDEGCCTTGYIPRKSFEHFESKGLKNMYRNNNTFIEDDICDELGLVINVKDQGLVVISGCAHAGILNTIYAAQEITGIKKILAVIGGFHLALASNEYIDNVITEFLKINPQYIVPTHCTGFKAMKKFSEAMQDAFLFGCAGSSFLFENK